MRAQLDSLELLLNNPSFLDFQEKIMDSLDSTTATLLEITPKGLEDFITRERMLGSASELRQISVYFTGLKEDLEQQLNQQ